MKNIILFIWQLPQNLIGLGMILIHKICRHELRIEYLDGIKYYRAKHVNNCGVSSGNYIFLDSDVYIEPHNIKHEYGHQLQSKKLGWLYLFVIGIPSAIHNLINRKTHCNYYHFYTEKWADKLGKVDR